MGRYALTRTEGTPGFAAALACLVGLIALFAVTGVYAPGDMARSPASPREIIGVGLMLTCISTYFLVAWTIGQRRSLELVEELGPWLPDPAESERASTAIRGAARRTLWIGALIGIVLGSFNTQPIWTLGDAAYPVMATSISGGQMLLWCIIGMWFTTRVATSRAFARLGEHVRFDLLRLDTLRPLARNGVVDVAIIVGALLFVPLQALDAEFRIENYLFALTVALPSIAFFVAWPIRGLHRRIRTDRDERLTSIDQLIGALPFEVPATAEQAERLETLLAHRERLADARTWPVDLRLASRVFFYLVIPPLAWAAAAVVERIVDSALASG